MKDGDLYRVVSAVWSAPHIQRNRAMERSQTQPTSVHGSRAGSICSIVIPKTQAVKLNAVLTSTETVDSM
jgi:hypothetical protein